MPIYEYQAVENGCEHCRERFDVIQKMSDAPLEKCPKCGAPVRKCISRVNVGRDILSNSNIKDKGFHKLVKKEKGVYEKVT